MSLAATTVYLYIGFDDRRRKCGGEWPHELGGHIELVDHLESRAQWLEELYEKEFADLNLPCVFDYDITENLGMWLYENLEAPYGEFAAEAHRLVREQME